MWGVASLVAELLALKKGSAPRGLLVR